MSRSQGHEYFITVFSPDGKLYQVCRCLLRSNMPSRLSRHAGWLLLLFGAGVQWC